MNLVLSTSIDRLQLPLLCVCRCFCTCGAVAGLFCSNALAQEDDSLEGLYLAASEKAQAGDFEGAIPLFEKILKIYGTTNGDDYGSGFGSIYFDYGTCLLQLFRWEKARNAFKTCVRDYSNTEEEKKSKIDSVNRRWKLAIFQWGYCEQMLKNPDKALELYQRYLDSKPDPKELNAVRNVYTLRVGGALISTGKVEEGEVEITKLFDNREKWKVHPQFLMQGLLELGLGWVEQAKKQE